MIEEAPFNQYIFSDGKILSMACDHEGSTIDLRLRVRKYIEKQIEPCVILLHFEGVIELDILDDFGTSGNYSDIVLVRLPNNQFNTSFDPYGNSGEPKEGDNFVIKAENCLLKEE